MFSLSGEMNAGDRWSETSAGTFALAFWQMAPLDALIREEQVLRLGLVRVPFVTLAWWCTPSHNIEHTCISAQRASLMLARRSSACASDDGLLTSVPLLLLLLLKRRDRLPL